MFSSTSWRVAVNSDGHLSSTSAKILQNRGLKESEITEFSTLLDKFDDSELSATTFLKSLMPSELQTIQKANALVSSIDAESLSEEGAINLFAMPDGTHLVDLNNDGFIDVGVAKTIRFPPVNSPQFVREAWEEATREYNEVERAVLDLTLHGMVFGLHMDGATSKSPPLPETQWSRAGVDELFTNLYANLDYRVSHDGWTEHNLRLKAVYEKFESSLLNSLSAQTLQNTVVIKNILSNREAPQSALSVIKRSGSATKTDQVVQLILDAKIDSDRIEVSEKKKNAIISDASPSRKEKVLQEIKSEIEGVIEQSRQLFSENEIKRSIEHASRFGNEKLEEQHFIK